MSQLPASGVRTLRAQVTKNTRERASSALGPIVAAPPVEVPAVSEEPRDISVVGPRKLIRPTLPARALRDRRFTRQDDSQVLWRNSAAASFVPESSHAESFYFQKQVQAQTPMVFVLEDGEKIEGCIEWYDRNAIKVRCSSSAAFRPNSARTGESASRVLIYKSGIKYLYKAGENQPML